MGICLSSYYANLSLSLQDSFDSLARANDKRQQERIPHPQSQPVAVVSFNPRPYDFGVFVCAHRWDG